MRPNPPFVSINEQGVIVDIPLPEALNVYRVCQDTMREALINKDPVAIADIYNIFAVATDKKSSRIARATATMSAFMLVDIFDQTLAQRNANPTAFQAMQQTVIDTTGQSVEDKPVSVGCTHPSDVPCEKCGG